jgi:hypothetical protein
LQTFVDQLSSNDPEIRVLSPVECLHTRGTGEDVHLPFSLLDVDESFLQKDPDKWPADPEFKKLQLFINNFRVTNDCAESACQLVTVLDRKITKNEEQRQYF